jgi:carbonic anhydrase/acetyltransferase-like protein (isoleucine patch superfamily)
MSRDGERGHPRGPGASHDAGGARVGGPHSYLVGCRIGDDVFLATSATVFNGAIVGERSEVRIRGVVHLRTTLPPDSTVPIGWVAVGTPAIIRAPGDHDESWEVQQSLDFPGYVFRMDRPPPVSR